MVQVVDERSGKALDSWLSVRIEPASTHKNMKENALEKALAVWIPLVLERPTKSFLVGRVKQGEVQIVRNTGSVVNLKGELRLFSTP